MNELWRPVVGKYEASNQGNIRNSLTGRVLKPSFNHSGYAYVDLCVEGKRLKKAVHLLVLEAFSGVRPEGMQGCHGSGGKADNSLANLSWDTPTRNNREHKRRDGTDNRGQRHWQTPLTNEDVRMIRHHLAVGNKTQKALATEYGVSYQAIHAIHKRKTWKHV